MGSGMITYQYMKQYKNFNHNLNKSCRRSINVKVHDSLINKGPDLWNKTYYPKLSDTMSNKKRWYIINAEGQTLGRLATLAATTIRGKMNPKYHPAMNIGDYVIVINAEKINVTGKKYWKKYYFRHTQNKRSGAGRIGGYRVVFFKEMVQCPERIVEEAVFGMLPKDRMGKCIRTKLLKVFKGGEHPHIAQCPKNITHRINS